MYKIISNGKPVAFTEKPPYVKVVNGYSKPCNVKQATGVVAGGNCWNLVGHNDFPGRPTAWVTIVDGWEIVHDDNGKVTVMVGDVSDLQDVTCEHDVTLEEIQEAICDIDERIGG